MDIRYRIGFVIAVLLIVTGMALALQGDGLATQWQSLPDGSWNGSASGDDQRTYQTIGFVALTAGFFMNILIWVRFLPESRIEFQESDPV